MGKVKVDIINLPIGFELILIQKMAFGITFDAVFNNNLCKNNIYF
jgi:hypothetical protein